MQFYRLGKCSHFLSNNLPGTADFHVRCSSRWWTGRKERLGPTASWNKDTAHLGRDILPAHLGNWVYYYYYYYDYYTTNSNNITIHVANPAVHWSHKMLVMSIYSLLVVCEYLKVSNSEWSIPLFDSLNESNNGSSKWTECDFRLSNSFRIMYRNEVQTGYAVFQGWLFRHTACCHNRSTQGGVMFGAVAGHSQRASWCSYAWPQRLDDSAGFRKLCLHAQYQKLLFLSSSEMWRYFVRRRHVTCPLVEISVVPFETYNSKIHSAACSTSPFRWIIGLRDHSVK